jgi:hypothetical protein
MNSKILVLIMASTLLIPFASTVVAQPDQPTLPGWDLGILYEDNEETPFMVENNGEVTLDFWIDNQNPYSIMLELEYEVPWEAKNNGEGNVSLDSGENVTFSLTISDIDVFSIAAKSEEPFTITATLQERGGIPVFPESKEANGELEIPEIFDLRIEIDDPLGPVNSGTDYILKVTVSNEGNSQDKASEIEVTDDCPLLTTDDALQAITSRTLESGAKTEANLKISASESHPSRSCKIEVTVKSKGAAGTQLSTDNTRVNIESSPQNQEDPEENNNDENESPTEIVSSNLPAPGISIIFSILIGALFSISSRRF